MSPQDASTERQGISLLGILLSLVAIAAVASVAIPRFFERPEVTLDNAARLLARDLRMAQNHAAYLGRPVAVEFRRDGYRAVDPERGLLHRGRSDEPFERSYRDEGVFRGVTLEDIHFPNDSVVFAPEGRAATGGALAVVFRGERRELSITPGSGRIEIVGGREPYVDDLESWNAGK